MGTGHTGIETDAFSAFQVPRRLSRIMRERILATTESIALRLQKPTIWQYKTQFKLYTWTGQIRMTRHT